MNPSAFFPIHHFIIYNSWLAWGSPNAICFYDWVKPGNFFFKYWKDQAQTAQKLLSKRLMVVLSQQLCVMVEDPIMVYTSILSEQVFFRDYSLNSYNIWGNAKCNKSWMGTIWPRHSLSCKCALLKVKSGAVLYHSCLGAQTLSETTSLCSFIVITMVRFFFPHSMIFTQSFCPKMCLILKSMPQQLHHSFMCVTSFRTLSHIFGLCYRNKDPWAGKNKYFEEKEELDKLSQKFQILSQ